MAALSDSTVRKFEVVRLTLEQLKGMGPNLSGVYWIVGERARVLLSEAVAEAQQAFERG